MKFVYCPSASNKDTVTGQPDQEPNSISQGLDSSRVNSERSLRKRLKKKSGYISAPTKTSYGLRSPKLSSVAQTKTQKKAINQQEPSHKTRSKQNSDNTEKQSHEASSTVPVRIQYENIWLRNSGGNRMYQFCCFPDSLLSMPDEFKILTKPMKSDFDTQSDEGQIEYGVNKNAGFLQQGIQRHKRSKQHRKS